MHRPTDPSKLAEITKSMTSEGWIGRPLVVHQDDNGGVPHYQAWTGSHRLAAAMATGLESVPCVVVGRKQYRAASESNGWNGNYDQPYDVEMLTPDLREAGFLKLANLLELN